MAVNREKKIYVAIDFGTTNTGAAYVTNFDPEPSYISAKSLLSIHNGSFKQQTAVLLDRSNRIIGLGNDAIKNYDSTKNKLFKRFKMGLYSENRFSSIFVQPVSCCADVQSSISRSATEESVELKSLFREVFRFFKEKLLEKERGINDENIEWGITVPAIWDGAAKNYMIEAAKEARLKNVKLILEPEAAAIYTATYYFTNKNSPLFKIGDSFMVIDAGGGTIDISIMRYEEERGEGGGYSLIHHANGGPWGALNIDKIALEKINRIFGKLSVEEAAKENPEDWQEFIEELEQAKFEADSTFNLNFFTKLEGYDKERVLEQINDYNDNSNQKIEIVNKRSLRVKFSNEFRKQIFKSILDQIHSHLNQLLSIMREKKIIIKKYILVGGFCQSDLLQEKFRTIFGDRQIEIPGNLPNAIINGAIEMLKNPNFIKSRIVDETIGIEITKIWDEQKHSNGGIKKLINGKWKCTNVFDVLFSKGEKLNVGTEIKKNYIPIEETQTSVYFTLFGAPENSTNINVVNSDFEKKAEIIVPIPRTNLPLSKRSIEVTFKPAGTNYQFIAKYVPTGEIIQVEQSWSL
eukprot:TRINITY_DN839_c1_g1_i4.p1 TRINITY_DN839_c1_g1~~TRINITY_DN839_c1_g1_i4.p1  ORF type:complete len:577 (+),score=241.62 TRINITY_DN839_c1_g1_i4:144-1874(+)